MAAVVKYRIKRVRENEGDSEIAEINERDNDVPEGGESLSTLVSRDTSPLYTPTQAEVPSLTEQPKRPPSHPQYHRNQNHTRSTAPTPQLFALESATSLLEDAARTLIYARCPWWSAPRTLFCSRSITSAFLLYKRFYNEHRVNLKSDTSKLLITDYALIMDEVLAQFCSCKVGTRSELTQDAFEFCQVMGRMAPDNDGIVHFCRRTSRTTQEEMEQCVDTSIANRKNDTLVALFMWPLHNAIAIL
jgi:hypothetical protein